MAVRLSVDEICVRHSNEVCLHCRARYEFVISLVYTASRMKHLAGELFCPVV
jgi:hypothetical protein